MRDFLLQIFDAWAESASGSGDQIYVECSTILPQTSRRLAEKAAGKKVALVAGPVFGRPDAAAAGKLTGLLAGASQDVRDKLKPLVGSYAGATILDLGDDPGSANALKLSGKYVGHVSWRVMVLCRCGFPPRAESTTTPTAAAS